MALPSAPPLYPQLNAQPCPAQLAYNPYVPAPVPVQPAAPVDPAAAAAPPPPPPAPEGFPVIMIQPDTANTKVNINVSINNKQDQDTGNTTITILGDGCEDVCENVCFFCCFSCGRGKIDADPGSEPLLATNAGQYRRMVYPQLVQQQQHRQYPYNPQY